MKVYKQQLYDFLVVRFNSKGEFQPVMKFLFPNFADQKIFFNEYYDKMIVYTHGNRVFLYKRKDVPSNTKDLNEIKEVKWDYIRQIKDFPFSLEEITPYTKSRLICFTPDFSSYLKENRRDNDFEITHLDSGDLHSKVPTDILSLKYWDSLTNMMNRFGWISNNEFIYCDTSGVERRVNIERNYEEVS